MKDRHASIASLASSSQGMCQNCYINAYNKEKRKLKAKAGIKAKAGQEKPLMGQAKSAE